MPSSSTAALAEAERLRVESEIKDNELVNHELRLKNIQIAKEHQAIAASELIDNNTLSLDKEERIKNVAFASGLIDEEQQSRIKDWQSVSSYQVDRSTGDIANRLIEEEQKRRVSLIDSSIEEEKATRVSNRRISVTLLDNEIVYYFNMFLMYYLDKCSNKG